MTTTFSLYIYNSIKGHPARQILSQGWKSQPNEKVLHILKEVEASSAPGDSKSSKPMHKMKKTLLDQTDISFNVRLKHTNIAILITVPIYKKRGHVGTCQVSDRWEAFQVTMVTQSEAWSQIVMNNPKYLHVIFMSKRTLVSHLHNNTVVLGRNSNCSLKKKLRIQTVKKLHCPLNGNGD